MKIFRFWSRVSESFQVHGRDRIRSCLGWSNSSQSEADQNARQRLDRVVRIEKSGQTLDEYAYGDRPLREEVVEELQHQGRTVAILTRNAYGALVLNTETVLFADVDLPPQNQPPSSIFGALLSIVFGGAGPQHNSPNGEQAVATLEHLQRVCETHDGLGMRIYQTCAGYRVLVTSRTFSPTSPESDHLLSQLKSDPLYQALCRRHECYRARLTPKPWRCGSPRPPTRFPWASGEAEASYKRWLTAYQEKSTQFATCRLLETLGQANVDSDIQAIIAVHDSLTVDDRLPLA